MSVKGGPSLSDVTLSLSLLLFLKGHLALPVLLLLAPPIGFNSLNPLSLLSARLHPLGHFRNFIIGTFEDSCDHRLAEQTDNDSGDDEPKCDLQR